MINDHILEVVLHCMLPLLSPVSVNRFHLSVTYSLHLIVCTYCWVSQQNLSFFLVINHV